MSLNSRFSCTILFLFLAVFSSGTNANRMVCYFGSWADYRPGDGNFVVEDIDPNLCTHVIYAFVVLGDNAAIKIRETKDYDRMARFVNLKKKNPELKTMVAIGGWNDDPVRYSQTFQIQSNRDKFAKNAVELLQKYGFDGLDIDWEYPARRGGAPSDKKSYTELIRTVKEAFKPYGYLLTAAVSATEETILVSYEPQKLGEYLDFINVMAYDFHSGWEWTLGHNAPLYSPAYTLGSASEKYNVDASIKAWIKHGAPAEKLVLGVGTYGQSFRAMLAVCVVPGCSNHGPGYPGPFTQQGGMLGYNEICLKEQELTYTKHFDERARVPYITRDVDYISYDNVQSAQEKADYVLANNLGGAMIWSIETDDFRGICGKGRYPLLTVLKNGVIKPTTTTTTTTTQTSTTQLATSTTQASTSTPQVPSSTTSQVLTSTTSASTSTSQVPSSTSSQVPSSTTSQVPSSTTSQVPSSTTSQVPSSTTSQVPSSTTSQVPSSTTSQVPSSTTSQVPSSTTSQVPSSTTSQVPSSTTSQASTSTTSQVPSSTTSQVPSSTTSQVPSSTTSQVPSSTTSQVPSSTTSQVPSSTTSQVPSSTTSQVPSSTTSQVPSSTTSQVPSSTTSQVPSSTTSQVPSSTTSQVPSSTTSQVPSSTTSQASTSTTSQVPSSTTSQVPSSTTSQVPSSTTSHVPSSTTSQVPSSTTSQVPSSTTSQVPSSTTSQVPSSTTSQVPSSTTSQVPSSTTSQVPTSTTSASSSTTQTSSTAPSTTPQITSTITSPQPTSTTSASTSSSTTLNPSTVPSTEKPGEFNPCTEVGLVRDSNDCRIFYHCRIVFDNFFYTKFICPNELVFDTHLFVCNYRQNVPDCEGK